MGDLNILLVDLFFYLYYVNLDRLWWLWQSLNLLVRLSDILGLFIMMNFVFFNVILVYLLLVGVSGVDIIVGDVMKIDVCGMGGSMCYIYDFFYILL